MFDNSRLETLYREAQAALKSKDYDRAASLLSQIVAVDESYLVASRLLARAIRLKRRHWYNDPRLWGLVAGIAVIGLLAWLAPRASLAIFSPTSASTATAAVTEAPTAAYTASPTPLPLAWRRISTGQDFPRNTITALAIAPSDPDGSTPPPSTWGSAGPSTAGRAGARCRGLRISPE